MVDQVLPFQLESGFIRGRITRLSTLIQQITSQHTYPPLVNRYLAEAIALAVVVSDCFKFDGLFTLQIVGNGPVRLMVVDVTSTGQIRACVRLTDKDHPLLITQSTATVQELFGTGYLAFTIDHHQSQEPYQGMVDLTGTTLAQCMHHFFRQSEQLDTGIIVLSQECVSLSPKQILSVETPPIVGALMVQRLPLSGKDNQDDYRDIWIKALSSLGTLKNDEFLSSTLSFKDILYRLFWEEGVRVFKEKSLYFQCRCTKEKLSSILKTFTQSDLEEIAVQENVEVTCDFCNAQYTFHLKELETLK